MIYNLDLPPHPVIVENEGFIEIPYEKCNNPGGDWHPGWAVMVSSSYKTQNLVLNFLRAFKCCPLNV